jgi:hypothetical protein
MAKIKEPDNNKNNYFVKNMSKNVTLTHVSVEISQKNNTVNLLFGKSSFRKKLIIQNFVKL